MKKTIIFLILILLLTGCNKEINEVEYNIDKNYFEVFLPYKEGVGKNYIVNTENNTIDLDNIKTSLMRLSSEYFSNIDLLYMEGQYLEKNKIKELLNTMNTSKSIFIKMIEEQNYVDKSGKLNGISLGIVLSDSDYIFGEEKAKELLSYLRSIEGLEKIDVAIALYLQGDTYKKIGFTNTEKIKFKDINEKTYLLTDSKLQKISEELYNEYKNLETEIRDKFNTFSAINGEVFCINSIPKTTNINIYLNTTNKFEGLAVSQFVSEKLKNDFPNNIFTEVKIYLDYNLKLIVSRNTNYFNPKIYIID